MAGDEETEAFEATACDVGEDGSFECNIRGVSFKGNISYSQGKFVISSDEINDVWRRDDGVRRSATSFLSLNTIMRVVTDEGHIYADGRFYSPDRLRGPHRFTDLDIFTVVPELGNITKNEKGEKGKIGKGSWQKGSIFHVIDKSNNVFTSDTIKPNILICDDKDNEIADFVAIENEDTKGIFNLGYYYLRARLYNPLTGRFASLDLFSGLNNDPQSLHKYAYCNDNSINRIDYSGRFSLIKFIIAVAIIDIIIITRVPHS